MNKIDELNQKLKYWQRFLNLQQWDLKIKLVDFKRTDYPQSGDIEVDLKNKKATILLSNNPRYSDKRIIVHELVHLLLWEHDHFCENLISTDKKDQYFDLLKKLPQSLQIFCCKMKNSFGVT